MCVFFENHDCVALCGLDVGFIALRKAIKQMLVSVWVLCSWYQ